MPLSHVLSNKTSITNNNYYNKFNFYLRRKGCVVQHSAIIDV